VVKEVWDVEVAVTEPVVQVLVSRKLHMAAAVGNTAVVPPSDLVSGTERPHHHRLVVPLSVPDFVGSRLAGLSVCVFLLLLPPGAPVRQMRPSKKTGYRQAVAVAVGKWEGGLADIRRPSCWQ
jgi:hypothetical protein